MAPHILGLRVGTLFTLGLLLLLIIISGPMSVSSFLAVKNKGPNPQIKIIIHPPTNAIVSKKGPLFLPCVANYTGPPYDYNSYEDDGDSDENEEMGQVFKMHKTHFSDLIPDDTNSPKYVINNDYNDNIDDDNDRFKMFKRNADHSEKRIIYKWLRNGEDIENFNKTDFLLLPNGTLKISFSKFSTGYYQCIADGTFLGVGAVISETCFVQQATFTKLSSTSLIQATINSSIVINCPFYSIPAANISWLYANNSVINIESHNRYFQLLNGSLLITNIQEEDNQKIRCSAKNIFSSKTQRQYAPNIQISSSNERLESKLLSPLQNSTIIVKTGDTLTLYCSAKNSERIYWSFKPRFNSPKQQLNDWNYFVKFKNVSQAKHDGVYNCSSSTDHQLFDVTVSSPPIILQNFSSIISPMGSYLFLNCTATGNPKPSITWYRNGKPIEFGNVVTYDPPLLKINTYEEMHKGIYQCVVKNAAGEIQVTGLLSWENKSYMKRPEKVKCYPVNRSTVLVEFQSKNEWSDILYYTSNKNKSGSQIWMANHLKFNSKIDQRFFIKNLKCPPFQLFYLYIRGLEKTGLEKKGESGSPNFLYEMSRMSKGVKCSIQGLEIYSIVHSGGVFIWWPSLNEINPVHLLIQIWHNDTSTPTKFPDQIIGTTQYIDDYSHWSDVQGKLEKITATTNIYPQNNFREKRTFALRRKKYSMLDSDRSQLFKTDDLKDLPSKLSEQDNIAITEIRVSGNVTGIFLPNINKITVRVLVPVMNGDEEFDQDMSYVEWITIPKSKNHTLFQIKEIESRNIVLNTTNNNMNCVKICYTHQETDCQEITKKNSLFDLKPLLPNTPYKLHIYSCNSAEYIPLDEMNVRTKFDVPGPIMNHKISKNNGIRLEWSPPMNTSGNLILYYYLIEWSTRNETHKVNVSKEQTIFQFPPTGKDERLNVTIRAVGNVGIGIPIYIYLKDYESFQDAEKTPRMQYHDPTLGISIGVLLSIFCIIICMLIIIKHRTCRKNEPANPHRVLTSGSSPTTICNQDLHEMQTLIAKPSLLNGSVKYNDNNTVAKNDDKSKKTNVTSTIKNNKNDADIAYSNEIPVIAKKIDDITVSASDSPRLSNNDNEQLANHLGATEHQMTNINQDTDLQQNLHSILDKIPASNIDSLRITENPQYSADSTLNSSIFDNSQQQLLNSTIDSSNINLKTINETDNTIDHNSGNSYINNSLHNWNFRRPLVGPNG